MKEDTVLYFDNAATTALRPEALEAMLPFLTAQFGNPSGVYRYAKAAKKAVEAARLQIAEALGALPEEIYFTSGGTESDNWAIKGAAEFLKQRNKGRHIITTAIEHHAVMHTCDYLQKNGFEVTYLPVDKDGLVSLEDVKNAIRPDTILLSVMLANNEIGTIQPLDEISQIAKAHKIWLHTDAVQAVGHIPVDVNALGVDLLTLSAHKFYGPKGVGALYIRKGVQIAPLLHGGAQERKHRAGTENVPGIVGMGEALRLACSEQTQEVARLTALRNSLIEGIEAAIPHVHLNGSPEKRLPGNVNFSIDFIEGESLLLLLEMRGCCASSGSACTSGSLDPSHVLLAMGIPHEKAHGSIRLTLGHHNTEADVAALLSLLPPIVARLREMSPLYEDYLKSNSF